MTALDRRMGVAESLVIEQLPGVDQRPAVHHVEAVEPPLADGRRSVAVVNRVATIVVLALIRTYQAVVSPWVTQQCKYHPSCSAYGLEAVRAHGAIHGTTLAVTRVLRCNPWSDGGVDYVPGTPDRLRFEATASPMAGSPADTGAMAAPSGSALTSGAVPARPART